MATTAGPGPGPGPSTAAVPGPSDSTAAVSSTVQTQPAPATGQPINPGVPLQAVAAPAASTSTAIVAPTPGSAAAGVLIATRKRVYTELTKWQKRELCVHKKENPRMTQAALAEWCKITFRLEGSVDRTTVSKVLSKAATYLDGEPNSTNRRREAAVTCPYLEASLFEWFAMYAPRMAVSDTLVKEKGRQFAEGLGVPPEALKFSDGWLSRWKKRHGIKRYRCPVDPTEDEIRAKVSTYLPQNRFCLAATGLFYKLLPTTRAGAPSRAAVTLVLCANADGSEKVRPTVIGRAENPNSFQNVNRDNLGVDFIGNDDGCITVSSFLRVVKAFDTYIGTSGAGRRALLLVDGVGTTRCIELLEVHLKHVEVVFIPRFKNPMGAGISHALKRRYRRLLLAHVLAEVEYSGREFVEPDYLEVEGFDVLAATRMLASAWHEVPADTIRQCWSHVKIVPDAMAVEPLVQPAADEDMEHENDLGYLLTNGDEQAESRPEAAIAELASRQPGWRPATNGRLTHEAGLAEQPTGNPATGPPSFTPRARAAGDPKESCAVTELQQSRALRLLIGEVPLPDRMSAKSYVDVDFALDIERFWTEDEILNHYRNKRLTAQMQPLLTAPPPQALPEATASPTSVPQDASSTDPAAQPDATAAPAAAPAAGQPPPAMPAASTASPTAASASTSNIPVASAAPFSSVPNGTVQGAPTSVSLKAALASVDTLLQWCSQQPVSMTDSVASLYHLASQIEQARVVTLQAKKRKNEQTYAPADG